MLTSLYGNESIYINFTTKIGTFHARVFDASKIKIYLLKQTFDNLHIHLGLFQFIDKSCNDIISYYLF